MLLYLLISLRPKQWVKNLFVVVPLFFSKNLGDISVVFHVLIAFVLFCLFSGSIYLLNDVVDLERDRGHQKKCRRPIAAGLISKRTALLSAGILAVISICGSLWLDIDFLFIGLIYLFINLAYIFFVRDLILLDVMFIASGFVLRVIAGGIVVNVPSSHWILMSTIFLALFLGFTKRRGEHALLKEALSKQHRPVLREYNIQLLDQFLVISATAAIISYSLYTVSDYALERFGTYNLVYTTPFVMFGIFYYLFLVQTEGLGDSPTEVLFTDKTLLVTIGLWLIAVTLIIGT